MVLAKKKPNDICRPIPNERSRSLAMQTPTMNSEEAHTQIGTEDNRQKGKYARPTLIVLVIQITHESSPIVNR